MRRPRTFEELANTLGGSDAAPRVERRAAYTAGSRLECRTGYGSWPEWSEVRDLPDGRQLRRPLTPRQLEAWRAADLATTQVLGEIERLAGALTRPPPAPPPRRPDPCPLHVTEERWNGHALARAGLIPPWREALVPRQGRHPDLEQGGDT